MMTSLLCLTLLAAQALSQPTDIGAIQDAEKSLYDFTMPDIDGKDVPLKKFKGKVVMVVNVASQCGLTPQYEGLQSLYKMYKSKGLVILGFPSNDFRNQEPGTNAEIKAFCEKNYGVTFPMFSKITVKGERIHPLYQWLIDSVEPKQDIEWNFAKFLVDREGRVVQRFGSRVRPDSEDVKAALSQLLK